MRWAYGDGRRRSGESGIYWFDHVNDKRTDVASYIVLMKVKTETKYIVRIDFRHSVNRNTCRFKWTLNNFDGGDWWKLVP